VSYLFRPPTVREGPAGGSRLFEFYKLDKGVTVVKRQDGSFYQVRYPSDVELLEALTYYMGGHDHTITDAEATDLTNAGYGSYLTAL
jgi:hypothetical protein